MTKDEMRSIRRQLINKWLQESHFNGDTCTWCIRFLVRNAENNDYGMELKAYV